MKQFYYLISDLRGCKAGTKIRVHDWNDVEVQVSMNGSLTWFPRSVFDTFFTEDKNKVQNKVDFDGIKYYI